MHSSKVEPGSLKLTPALAKKKVLLRMLATFKRYSFENG
jgi:hypothetical protein